MVTAGSWETNPLDCPMSTSSCGRCPSSKKRLTPFMIWLSAVISTGWRPSWIGGAGLKVELVSLIDINHIIITRYINRFLKLQFSTFSHLSDKSTNRLRNHYPWRMEWNSVAWAHAIFVITWYLLVLMSSSSSVYVTPSNFLSILLSLN